MLLIRPLDKEAKRLGAPRHEGETIWIAPIEYVIFRKLQYYREGRSEKHLRHIAEMLLVSHGQIDFEWLQQRIEQDGLLDEWEGARALSRESHGL